MHGIKKSRVRMERIMGAVLTAFVLLCLYGCAHMTSSTSAQEQKTEGSFTVYYKNASGDALTGLPYSPVSETFDEILSELLTRMEQSPSEDRISVFDGTVYCNTFTRGVDNVTVDLSADYLALSSIDQVLLRAGIVKTLVQIPGVAKVYLTVEEQSITNEAGEAIGPMDQDSFIETHGGSINSLQSAELILYFSDLDGSGLATQIREVDYSSNLIMEEVVLRELIAGTGESSLLPIAAADTGINSITVEDTVCFIDFDSRVNGYTGKADAETCLYAIVNSICVNCEEVQSVQITIDGSVETRFRDQINLDQTFLPRMELVEEENMEETE